MRISDWSSDVCSSDLFRGHGDVEAGLAREAVGDAAQRAGDVAQGAVVHVEHPAPGDATGIDVELVAPVDVVVDQGRQQVVRRRSEEHTSELQSLMRNSYAVFCLKKKKQKLTE